MADLIVMATNEQSLDTLAVAASIGASVSGTAAVSVAGSVTLATLDANTLTSASLRSSTLTNPNNVSVLAFNDTDIETQSVAATLTLAAGSSAAVGVSFAVVETVANVGGITEAVINPSTVTSADNVLVEAIDISEVDTLVVSATIGVAASSTAAIDVSISVSLATVNVSNSLLASIQGSVIEADNVTVNAQSFMGGIGHGSLQAVYLPRFQSPSVVISACPAPVAVLPLQVI